MLQEKEAYNQEEACLRFSQAEVNVRVMLIMPELCFL